MCEEIIKKYTFCIQWIEEEGIFMCRCFEFPSTISLGDTAEEALLNIEKMIDELVHLMQKEGEKLPWPLSPEIITGNMRSLHIAGDKYFTILDEADLGGIPIDDFILIKLLNPV